MVFKWTILAEGSFTAAKYEYPALTSGEKLNYVNDYQLIQQGRPDQRAPGAPRREWPDR